MITTTVYQEMCTKFGFHSVLIVEFISGSNNSRKGFGKPATGAVHFFIGENACIDFHEFESLAGEDSTAITRYYDALSPQIIEILRRISRSHCAPVSYVVLPPEVTKLRHEIGEFSLFYHPYTHNETGQRIIKLQLPLSCQRDVTI